MKQKTRTFQDTLKLEPYLWRLSDPDITGEVTVREELIRICLTNYHYWECDQNLGFDINPVEARALAHALLRAADEIERPKPTGKFGKRE